MLHMHLKFSFSFSKSKLIDSLENKTQKIMTSSIVTARQQKISPIKIFEKVPHLRNKFYTEYYCKSHSWITDCLTMYHEGSNKIITATNNMAVDPKAPYDLVHTFIPEFSLSRDISLCLFQYHMQNKDNVNILLGQDQLVPRTLSLLSGLSQINLEKINNFTLCSSKRYVEEILQFHLNLNNLQHKKIKNSLKVNQEDIDQYMFNTKEQNLQYDIIDIESQGSGIVFMGGILNSIKNNGLVCLVFTDFSKKTQQAKIKQQYIYSSFNPVQQCCVEDPIRIIYQNLQHQASYYDRFILPQFFISTGMYIKLYFKVTEGKNSSQDLIQYYIGCDFCQYRLKILKEIQHVQSCPQCQNKLRFGGPFWNGPLIDEELIENMDIGDTNNPNIMNKPLLKSIVKVNLDYHKNSPSFNRINFFKLVSVLGGSKISPSIIYGTFKQYNFDIIQSCFSKNIWITNAPFDFIYDFIRIYVQRNQNSADIADQDLTDQDEIKNENNEVDRKLLAENFLLKNIENHIEITDSHYKSPHLYINQKSLSRGFVKLPFKLFLRNMKDNNQINA